VSRYQKGKTNLDFTEARDSEWQWHQLGHMQICTSLQTNNHASTPPLSFLQAGCPSCRPTNSVKALKAVIYNCTSCKIGCNCTSCYISKLCLVIKQRSFIIPKSGIHIVLKTVMLIVAGSSWEMMLSLKLSMWFRPVVQYLQSSVLCICCVDC